MKKNNFWKRFWTMNVHNHEGFTLVELIIVIAILAILSSVAVVGYSSYVEKANKQADLTLAAEIENALILAMYSDALTAGDYVVIRYGEDAVFGNANDDTIITADAAMKAAYGDNWQTSLQLKWNGWELGVVGNAESMGYVNGSSYNGNGLNTLLGQVQNVVTAAGDYLTGTTLDNELLLEYVSKTDVVLGEGNKVTEENADAVANLAVFSVANTIVESNTGTAKDFYLGWMNGAVSEDPIANQAAKYSLALGMATYLDDKNNGTTDYVAQLTAETENPEDILDQMDAVIASMGADPGALVYLGDGSDTSAQGYKDAMAFLAYMEGVENSADTMLENFDIYSDNYFGDGNMASYVQNYVSAGSIISSLNVDDGAFVFIYDGVNVVCIPIDY